MTKQTHGSDDSEPTAATVLGAADAGDRLAELKAVRLVLAKAIDNPKSLARDLPPLTRRLMEVSKEIEALEAAQKAQELDKTTLRLVDTTWDEAAI